MYMPSTVTFFVIYKSHFPAFFAQKSIFQRQWYKGSSMVFEPFRRHFLLAFDNYWNREEKCKFATPNSRRKREWTHIWTKVCILCALSFGVGMKWFWIYKSLPSHSLKIARLVAHPRKKLKFSMDILTFILYSYPKWVLER